MAIQETIENSLRRGTDGIKNKKYRYLKVVYDEFNLTGFTGKPEFGTIRYGSKLKEIYKMNKY